MLRRRPASARSRPDLRVGEPRVRAEHRRIELVAADLARRREIAISHTIARRSTSGLSEHRPFESFSGSIGITRRGKYTEVPRSRASRVERVAVAHVVADVGDRHPQAKASCLLARCSTPRRRSPCAVSPSMVTNSSSRRSRRPRESSSRTSSGSDLRLRQRLLRELVRQVELAQRDLDLHAGIGVVAEHLGDAADRLRVRRRRLDELDGDDLAGLAPCPRSAGGTRMSCAMRRSSGTSSSTPCSSCRRPTMRRFARSSTSTIAPSGRPRLVAPGDAHRGAIAVHEPAHLVRRQEHRGAARRRARGSRGRRDGLRRGPATSEMRCATSSAPARFCTTSPERSSAASAGVERAPLARADAEALRRARSA